MGFLLVAANLRPAITGVGPLLGDIRASTGMSASAAGLLTTLPLLVFAAVSPLAPRLARRYGMERALLAAIVVLAAGLLLRSAGPVGVIFAGTAVLGAAIGVANVLLPGLVKQDFPHRPGLVTAAYSTTLAGMAGLASGVSVTMADGAGLGWRGSLAAWVLPAAAAALLWAPYARGRQRVPPVAATRVPSRLLRSPLAWQVSLFLGFQSLQFYALVTWLPTLLEEDGLSPSAAGWLLALMQFASLVTTIGVPILAGRRPSQRRLVVGNALLTLFGLVGLWTVGGDAPLVWILALGLGLGGQFGLSLLFLVLRAADARSTGALSGMAQSLGFLLAATGPITLGLLHDATGAWDLGLLTLVASLLLTLAFGLGAARDASVG